MRRVAGPKGKLHAVTRARQQRRAMTLPEIALWAVLRGRPEGFKFRRQHPVGRELALDFFCNDGRLCVEVDSEAHERGDRPERDAARDAFLAVHGIETLRVSTKDVLTNLDGVMTQILERVRAHLPLHHPALPGGPPPRAKLEED